VDKKPLIVVSICAVVLLVLGSSVPALAQTHFSLSKVIPSNSALLAEDYQVYIGAGMLRAQGKFGFGWNMTVVNTGDTPINGVFYMTTMTLSREVICDEITPFSITYPIISVGFRGATIDLHPINFINLSVEIGNMTYSKSGFEIGPFVLLVR
jgi:hypothetical protein